MKKMIKFVPLATIIVLSGCATMSDTQRGTAQGAAIGSGAALGAGAGYIWSQRMEEQKKQMESATAGTGVQVSQTTDNRLKLNIPSDISFDTGSADIKPGFRPILDNFAISLLNNPETFVMIVGHTDNTGTDAINNPLSVNRAASARDYLVSKGVPINRIQIDGRGSDEPVAANDTPANRAENRRVEIFVSEMQGEAPPAPKL